jgi:hypothetical protein
MADNDILADNGHNYWFGRILMETTVASKLKSDFMHDQAELLLRKPRTRSLAHLLSPPDHVYRVGPKDQVVRKLLYKYRHTYLV